MRFLADENFPAKAITVLRQLGHDVVWVTEIAPATVDEEILSWAVRESRVLLTLDKDFGELAFRWGLPADCGIVLFRITPIPDRVAVAAKRVVGAESELKNRFLVVDSWRVRERSLRG